MRSGFLTLIVTIIPALLTGAEPAPVPSKAPPPAPAANAALLEKKLAELKALQAEIRQLRKAAGKDQQLLIEVQLLEVSPKRFEGADEELDFSGVIPGFADGSDESTESTASKEPQVKAGMVLDARQLRQRLKQWNEKATVRIVAEPKMATVSGRPAQFLVGGMFPVPDKANHRTYQEYGTRIDVVAMAEEDGAVRLELRAHQSSLDNNHEIVVDGQKLPRLSVQQIDTAAKLLPEQILVVGTFAGDRHDVERSPEAAAPDEAEESGSKVAFIVLAQVYCIDGMLPVESDKGEVSQGALAKPKPKCRPPLPRDARAVSQQVRVAGTVLRLCSPAAPTRSRRFSRCALTNGRGAADGV